MKREYIQRGSLDTCNLLDFRDWLNEKINDIPDQYKEDATITLDTDCFYDSYTATLEIYYDREETDEEKAADERDRQLRIEDMKRNEIKILEQLKAKYEKS